MLGRSLQGLMLTALMLLGTPVVAAPDRTADDVPVYVNDHLVLRLRTATAEMSPQARFDLLAARLRTVLDGRRVDVAKLRIRAIRSQPTIMFGGLRLLTVTDADAAANNAAPWPLAWVWRNNLEDAFVAYNRVPVAPDISTMPDVQTTMLGQPETMPRTTMTSLPLASDDGATTVILNGRTILRFRTSAGGYTPEERYVLFQQNLQSALDSPITEHTVGVQPRHGEPAIFCDQEYLMTVTAADAAANGTTPSALASDWAGNLRRALSAIDRN